MDAISATIVGQIDGNLPVHEVYTASERLMLQHQLAVDVAHMHMRNQVPGAEEFEVRVFDPDNPFGH